MTWREAIRRRSYQEDPEEINHIERIVHKKGFLCDLCVLCGEKPLSRRDMKKSKSSISNGRSYKKIREFWDEHDLSDYWGKTRKVKFEVVLEPEVTYYPVEKDLSEKIQLEARKQGVPSDTLVNLWLEQKVKERRPPRGGRRLRAKNV